MNPTVGDYLDRHFVAGFQKVATFQIVRGGKQGGNVASYFCTPDGGVLHAIAGPTDAFTFLREARWANETYELAQLNHPNPDELRRFFRAAHLARLRLEHQVFLTEEELPRPETVDAKMLDQLLERNWDLALNVRGKVHLLLTVGALPRIEQVYQPLFERILREKISTNPVALAGR